MRGVRGAINEAWGYDASAQYSNVSVNSNTLNYFVINRLQNALDVVDVGGVPTCQSVINGSDPNCVPWNPFQPGGITQDQLDYLQASGLQTGRINQEIYNAVVNGDLGVYGIKSPLASDGIQVVFGTEWRRDTLKNEVDSLQQAGQLAGSGGPTIGISGGTQVEELFFEGRIPIAQDRAGMESLSFDTAYRYSDYGDGVQTDTYKFGLEWAPIQDVRLRGSYQKAVRAANIVELFTAQGFNLFDMDGDPCGAANRDAEASEAECVASGVPAGNVGANALDSPAGQYNFLQGGNTTLTPEESDTYSYGIVFTPRFAPGLAITVDYYDIKIDNTISTFGSENSLNACYVNNDPAACARIHRNPNGQLWVGNGHIEDLNINIGSVETKGWDLNASLHGSGDGPLRQPELQPDWHAGGRVDHGAGTRHRPVRLRRVLFVGVQHQLSGRAHPRMAAPVPHELGDAVGSGSVVHLALPDQGRGLRLRHGPHRLRAAGRKLFRPGCELGDNGKGRGHARHQQRAGRQPLAQRDGWHLRQRQHLPADLRRPRSLRLRAGQRGLLKNPVRVDSLQAFAAALGPPLFFAWMPPSRRWSMSRRARPSGKASPPCR